MSFRTTGKLPSSKHLEQLKKSPNYKKGSFQNLSSTPMKPDDVTYWKMSKEFFKKHPEIKPSGKLPFIKTDLTQLNDDPVII
ncbi:MAG: hypothetical protein ABIP79_09635 [Chitinophagaceae bacterium]